MESGMGFHGSTLGTTPGTTGELEKTDELKRKASDLGESVRSRAMSAIDANKDQVSSALERMASSLEDDRFGRYAADYARRGAEFLRGRDAREIVSSATDGLRSRPAIMLSACFVAGLAFARMVRR